MQKIALYETFVPVPFALLLTFNVKCLLYNDTQHRRPLR